MSNNTLEALHAADHELRDAGRLKDDMDVIMEESLFEEDDGKQVMMSGVNGAGSCGDREIWFGRSDNHGRHHQESNLLLAEEDDDDMNNDACSLFYTDFPPIPDFPSMSSSSSSSSMPLPAKAVAASSSSSSSSSASSASWTTVNFKPEAADDANFYSQNSESELRQPQYQSSQHPQPAQEERQSCDHVSAVLSSTASMEIIFPPVPHLHEDYSCNNNSRDMDCINVMENFGYMDLLDSTDIWDPSSIFETDDDINAPQEQDQQPHHDDGDQFRAERKPAPAASSAACQTEPNYSFQPGGGGGEEEEAEGGINDDGLYFLQGNSELGAIFLEWLKQNKDYISAEDMRSIKLKRSTIECASKRLGSTKEGKKQLLKLILEWVEQYQLHNKKRATTESSGDPATAAVDPSSFSLYHYHHEQPPQPPPPPSLHETINPNPNPNPSSATTDLINCSNSAASHQQQQDPSSPWALPCESTAVPNSFDVAPAPFPPSLGGGYVCDPYSNAGVATSQGLNNGNLYPAEYPMVNSPQSWAGCGPYPMQYNPYPNINANLNPASGGGSQAQSLYGNPYPYQVYDGSGGGGEIRIGSSRYGGSSATKEARKKRMARQRRISLHQYRHHHHNHHHPHGHLQNQPLVNHEHYAATINGDDCTPANPAAGNWIYWSPAAPPQPPMASTMPPPLVSPAVEPAASQHQNHHQRQLPSSDRKQSWKTEKNLKFLLQKVLKQSDVGNLGRIVLPKKEAETHLPELDSRDGIPIAMEDIGTSNVWNMRYRFWPNNKSRMYLLENTGDFVRLNGLQEGDFIVIYSDTKCGKYLIRGVKVRQPGPKSEPKKPVIRRNQRNVSQAANSFSLASCKQTVK